MVGLERYGGGKSAMSEMSKPRQNLCQVVSNDFGFGSNFSRVFYRYFGATLSIGPIGFKFGTKVNMFDLWKGVVLDLEEF